jgi:lipoprotein-anchoring transpeptidase ErfK/SrfK
VVAPLVAGAIVLVPGAAALGAASASDASTPTRSPPLPGAPPVVVLDGLDRGVRAVPRAAPASRPRPKPKPKPALLVRIARGIAITSRPSGGRTVGLMPSRSKYLGTPTTTWVLEVSANGRYGRVPVPYQGADATGWIPLNGLARSWTPYSVHVDLSRHELTVLRLGRTILRVAAATGALGSPTPPGSYFVTDRVPVYVGSPFGSFAFGLSGIQTHLPAGWSGSGDQLAIHGTNAPASIGTSASAGCVRVSEPSLARLRPILMLGTPVVISR